MENHDEKLPPVTCSQCVTESTVIMPGQNTANVINELNRNGMQKIQLDIRLEDCFIIFGAQVDIEMITQKKMYENMIQAEKKNGRRESQEILNWCS